MKKLTISLTPAIGGRLALGLDHNTPGKHKVSTVHVAVWALDPVRAGSENVAPDRGSNPGQSSP